MSVLAALARAYERLAVNDTMPMIGYSSQSIYGCIVLNTDGTFAGPPAIWDPDPRGRPSARSINVPYFGGRSGKNPPPYFLWDNTAYVLGVTRKEFDAKERFEAFRALHERYIGDAADEGLKAVVRFLNQWNTDDFHAVGFPEALIDRNFVFRLAGDSGFVHERNAARDLWLMVNEPDTTGNGICLVSGERGPIARLHPPLVSFENPARIVAFDKDNDAFASYGHIQGENAPIGISAAFAYSAALNKFLERNSRNRIQIGDTSTVFWADASDAAVAELAEGSVAAMLGGEIEEGPQADRVGALLEQIRKGKPIADLDPRLADGVRFYVLGLAPNAARLSIRYWFEDDFGVLAEHYAAYVRDIAFEPWPAKRQIPSIASYGLRTAPARLDRANKFDRERISPLLTGELLRAILSGTRFPGSLLPLLLMRVRSDHLLDSIRISLIKGLIVRAMRVEGRLPKRPDGTRMEDYLVRSDPDDPNPARRLGRLFAVIERAQLAALGDDINATVKDKFLGAAAATPQQVFVGILKNAGNHLKRLRNGHSDASWIKDAAHARRVGAGLDRDIGQLWGSFGDGVPAQHSSEEQALFLVGYYQERYGRAADTDIDEEPNTDVASMTKGEE